MFREEEAEAYRDRENILRVTSEIHLAATLEVLGEFVTLENAAPFKLLLGYAGWGPHQLEGEICDGSWIPTELHPELLFEGGSEDLYERALKTIGLAPGLFVMGRGGSA